MPINRNKFTKPSSNVKPSAETERLIEWLASFEFVNGVMEAQADGNLFPINFEEVWRAVGYSRRDSAVRALTENSGLEVGYDYILDSGDGVRYVHTKVEVTDTSRTRWDGPAKYRLSGEGFQILCLSSHTEVGNKIRRAYVAIKREYELSQAETEASIEPQGFPVVTQEDLFVRYREVPNSTDFVITLEFANRMIRFHSIDYLKQVLLQDFNEGTEYIIVDGEILLTDATVHLLLATSRPYSRERAPYAPDYIVTPYSLLFRKQIRISANTRFGHR